MGHEYQRQVPKMKHAASKLFRCRNSASAGDGPSRRATIGLHWAPDCETRNTGPRPAGDVSTGPVGQPPAGGGPLAALNSRPYITGGWLCPVPGALPSNSHLGVPAGSYSMGLLTVKKVYFRAGGADLF